MLFHYILYLFIKVFSEAPVIAQSFLSFLIFILDFLYSTPIGKQQLLTLIGKR